MNKKSVDAKVDAMIETRSEPEFSLDRLIEEIESRLANDRRLRRTVPTEGRLRIDRSLPFLCAYRRPPDTSDAGTVELVTTEASYLFASGTAQSHDDLVRICRAVRDASLQRFNAFLLIEIWCENLDTSGEQNSATLHPSFRVLAADDNLLQGTVDAFKKALSKIHFSEIFSTVEVEIDNDPAPPGMRRLLSNESDSDQKKCYSIGLAVHPVYRSLSGDTLFPIVLQQLRRQLAIAIRKTLFAFTADLLEQTPTHFHSFGPTAMVKAVALVDQQLCDVATSFDYILQITPVNAAEAWEEFESGCFSKPPRFHYRPLSRNPSELKASLFDIPIDRIEDPTLSELFWEKQDELDRQIGSLADIDTPNFLYGSLQLYGEVERELLILAESLLRQTSEIDTTVNPATGDQDRVVCCDELIERAREEIAWYREQDENFHASVQRSNSIAAGIMVSGDTVLVDEKVCVSAARLDGLLHHEIGTHLLTYFNGRRQPFQQMYTGLAGYESFQEGIAVLAEYLVGGLTVSRIRTLAARVVAADMLVCGNSFVETFAVLRDTHGIAAQKAFRISTRIYRGGGTTKDAIYLRGLAAVLKYLTQCDGVEIDRLFVGKIGFKHIPAINELMRRKIIKPPQLMPRYLKSDRAQQLLEKCVGKSVLDLLGISRDE